ncbi:hypothetical protein FKW77_007913 [Venturia effusa]|uniref:Uncharacterized protein n=1 Tax=Venturia effusa TaxID=50376 RepID=A0A517L9M5_9PEZI|nr:hypothetical protein FKW77_007913 [Venturia effusa]
MAKESAQLIDQADDSTLRQWLNIRAVKELDTYPQIAFHPGSLWVRFSTPQGRIFLDNITGIFNMDDSSPKGYLLYTPDFTDSSATPAAPAPVQTTSLSSSSQSGPDAAPSTRNERNHNHSREAHASITITPALLQAAVTDLSSQSSPDATPFSPIRRKRGRPKKVDSSTAAVPTPAQAALPSPSSPSSSDATPFASIKRKRGRPKKVDASIATVPTPTQAALPSSSSQSSPDTPLKRKRGRPKKADASKTSTGTSNSSLSTISPTNAGDMPNIPLRPQTFRPRCSLDIRWEEQQREFGLDPAAPRTAARVFYSPSRRAELRARKQTQPESAHTAITGPFPSHEGRSRSPTHGVGEDSVIAHHSESSTLNDPPTAINAVQVTGSDRLVEGCVCFGIHDGNEFRIDTEGSRFA